jgi:uncharacterized damage-inducible protein DinB
MQFNEFLVAPIAFLAPDKSLDGLASADAERRVPGADHSVAEIVAHLTFWQEWFHGRCRGDATPMVASAALGWPEVVPGSWPEVRTRFIEGLEAFARLGDVDTTARLTPPIEFPPLAHYAIADALVHVATHNAHHFGQIIVLRQMLGAWPPPAGRWTW